MLFLALKSSTQKTRHGIMYNDFPSIRSTIPYARNTSLGRWILSRSKTRDWKIILIIHLQNGTSIFARNVLRRRTLSTLFLSPLSPTTPPQLDSLSPRFELVVVKFVANAPRAEWMYDFLFINRGLWVLVFVVASLWTPTATAASTDLGAWSNVISPADTTTLLAYNVSVPAHGNDTIYFREVEGSLIIFCLAVLFLVRLVVEWKKDPRRSLFVCFQYDWLGRGRIRFRADEDEDEDDIWTRADAGYGEGCISS